MKYSFLPRAIAFSAVVLTLGVTSLDARGDVAFGHDRELLAARHQNSFRTWKIEDTETGESYEVRQFASRLHGTIDMGESLDLVVYGSGGYSQGRAQSVDSIEGVGDLKLKGFAHVAQRRVLLSAGLNLPTGRTGLSEDDVRATQAISPTVLGFRMREYGRGFGIDLGIAAGKDVRPGVTLGGGASFLYHGAYDLDTTSEYQAAPEIALTAGADVRSASWAWTSDVTLRMFGTDQLDGTDSFEEGNQIELSTALRVRGIRWGLDLALRDVVKSDNDILTAASPTSDTRVENGNTLWFSASPRYQPRPEFALLALFDVVAANQSQQQSTSALAMGFGLGTEIRLTDVSIFELRLARLTGSSDDDTLDLSGWDGVMSLRWQY